MILLSSKGERDTAGCITGEPCERFADQKVLPHLHQPHRDYRTGKRSCQVFFGEIFEIIQKSLLCAFGILCVSLLLKQRPKNIYSQIQTRRSGRAKNGFVESEHLAL